MRFSPRVVFVTAIIAMICVFSTGTAEAGVLGDLTNGFSEGHWRSEVTVATGIHSGRQSRSGNMLYMANVEYEWPMYARASLGLRAYPLFVYDQDDGDTVTGAGFGLSGRYYFSKESRDGWFAEAGIGLLGHNNKFEGNSGSVNFIPQAGLGYKFQNDWHVTLQLIHFSNAGFAENNSGVNSLGLGIGRAF